MISYTYMCIVEAACVFILGLYTVFTIMLNIVNLTSFHIHNQTILYLLHMAYIFMMAILMLNFLIALFSHSVAEIMAHKEVGACICLNKIMSTYLDESFH